MDNKQSTQKKICTVIKIIHLNLRICLIPFIFRPQQRGRSAVIEGVYNNVHFMHAVASQIGNVVQIQTKSGAIFEGIFYTVSPHFEIVLQLVHRIEVSTSSSLSPQASSNTTSSTNSLTSSGNIGKIIIDFKQGYWKINVLNITTKKHNQL